MKRWAFIERGLMEDWEFTDDELMFRIKRLLLDFKADPLNGNRKTDFELIILFKHCIERHETYLKNKAVLNA